jgi:hypothetical protein
MTMTSILRRVAVLAAAVLLVGAVGAKPLYAANDDNTPKADDGSKKAEKKDSKKTSKAHVKTKKNTNDTTTSTGQMPGYRPDAVPGSGY